MDDGDAQLQPHVLDGGLIESDLSDESKTVSEWVMDGGLIESDLSDESKTVSEWVSKWVSCVPTSYSSGPAALAAGAIRTRRQARGSS